MTRVTIVLTEMEMERLHQSAKRELRHPREQARFILRSALFGDSVPTNSKSTSVKVEPTQTGAFASVNP